jgi:hypothetical protein
VTHGAWSGAPVHCCSSFASWILPSPITTPFLHKHKRSKHHSDFRRLVSPDTISTVAAVPSIPSFAGSPSGHHQALTPGYHMPCTLQVLYTVPPVAAPKQMCLCNVEPLATITPYEPWPDPSSDQPATSTQALANTIILSASASASPSLPSPPLARRQDVTSIND